MYKVEMYKLKIFLEDIENRFVEPIKVEICDLLKKFEIDAGLFF